MTKLNLTSMVLYVLGFIGHILETSILEEQKYVPSSDKKLESRHRVITTGMNFITIVQSTTL